MATEVQLPELGESVTEATVTGWLVEVGDRVELDQPLFELSSDKIDTEVPSPAAGVLKEIKVGVDETIDVGTVVAVIAEEDEEIEAAEDEPEPSGEAAKPAQEAVAQQPPAEAEPEQAPAASTRERPRAEREPEPARATEPARAAEGDGQAEDRLMSPIVRRLVNRHELDVSQISGSGKGGRITRADVEEAIARQAQAGRPAEAERPARA
ncbi:MAG: E3 binding domain-containing protein, partial [Actinomycetota bacterium]|nr:E3 binding domain-containing protein [Actinomycetota bacterium]